jgi:orotate phosphoribosyltransferase-like protein
MGYKGKKVCSIDFIKKVIELRKKGLTITELSKLSKISYCTLEYTGEKIKEQTERKLNKIYKNKSYYLAKSKICKNPAFLNESYRSLKYKGFTNWEIVRIREND